MSSEDGVSIASAELILPNITREALRRRALQPRIAQVRVQGRVSKGVSLRAPLLGHLSKGTSLGVPL